MANKQFECQVCHKVFSRVDYLNRHQVNHDAIKPYPCPQCNIGFARRDLRDKHFKSKIHKRRIDLLRRHESVATVEKPPTVVPKEEAPMDNYGWLFGSYSNPGSNTPPLDEPFFLNTVSPEPNVNIRDHSDSYTPQMFEDHTIGMLLEILSMPELNEIFHPVNLSYFVDLFWKNFDVNYPIIHRPINSNHPFLLISVISYGMVYSNSPVNISLACQIQRRLMKLQMDEICDSEGVSLESLQSLLLSSHFCSNIGDSSLHRQAKLFHGTIMGVVDLPSLVQQLHEPIIAKPESATKEELTRFWTDWIRYESYKRVAFFAYVCDSQHAYLNQGHTMISVFDLQLDLPYTDAVWMASDPNVFLQEYLKQPRELTPRRKETERRPPETSNWINIMPHIKEEGKWPNFLFSLRRLMQPYKEHQKEYNLNCFNQFSRLIILQGLISITWNLKWKGLQDLGIASKKKLESLTIKLQDAFDRWRDYFDYQIHTTNTAVMKRNPPENKDLTYLNRYDTSPIFWNNLTQHQFGLLLLYVDTHALQNLAVQYAATASSSNPYPRLDSSINIQAWIRNTNSQRTLVNACKLLRTVFFNTEIISCIPHLVKYVGSACLALWCFETYREDLPSDLEESSVANPMRYICNGQIHEPSAKEDSFNYLNMIIDDDENIDAKTEFVLRQQQVLGILCYCSLLFESNEWKSLNVTGLLLRQLVFKRHQNFE
ncbi:hypothetical protein OGAPHI_005419 [Ogataea philodendri]|uniref:C2H2-type domain-containing protein n=1 Tax=Ogataea philodendri TaxID=1378263 RepID=A0A9P8NZL5_9ASCO|nr:uncharacterized protein OGAPHI_005419 [Ogataea philodendri]KAH3662171.1 hypothetical protein OGAPHI_005419 [Ogataea philodendri]